MPELNKAFQPYIGKPVALYGLSTATEKALPDLQECLQIVGLLDSFTESGSLYGLPILPFQKAVDMPVALIIVVARPGSCKAIVKKIGDTCRQCGIALLDIRGKDLLTASQPVYTFQHVSGYTRVELERKLRTAEAVSFDLFDTLVTRRVLLPTDIYDLVDAALKDRGVHIPEFSKKRLEYDMTLSRTGAPKLEEIYERLIAQCESAAKLSAAELVQLEWEIDFNTVLPREAVCEIFKRLIREGKRVSIVSDTFYSSAQLAKLLEKCGIHSFENIYASCEYGVGKTQGLFEKYKEAVPAASYLHIGDNIAADIEAASRAGMDTYRLYSGVDLLNETGELGMGAHMDALADRLKIGLFVSRLFNDPFQFEMKDRKITVSGAENIGYLFCAPLMTDFVLWFHEKVREYDFQNIWFSARDGYLVRRMYRELAPERETVYFLTSRTAAIRAGVKSEADIAFVDSMKFTGTVEDNLRVRFGIEAEECENRKNGSQTGLLQYKDVILDKAKEHSRNYLRYIETLPIKDGPIAFFDFVARGTTQLYLKRLIPNPMKGLYFMRMESEFMPDNDLDIESFYKAGEVDSSALFEDYFILETIVTAPHASVSCMDENGEPTYADETRMRQEIECALRVQNGVLTYFREFLELVPEQCRDWNEGLNEAFLVLLHRIHIADEDFLSLVTEDPFLNRRMSVETLLA